MNEELLQLLESVLGKSISYRNNEAAFHCPFCHHYKKKLQINLVSQLWHCWVCEKKGVSVKNLLYEVKADPEKIREAEKFKKSDYEFIEKKEKEDISLPSEFIPLYNPSEKLQSPTLISVLMYLKQRKITKDDVIKYGIGYCEQGEYANRIIIPSFDTDGNLNYFIARSFFDEERMKYKNPTVSKDVVGFEQFINWKMPVVLVEGVFDAMAIKRNAIPLFGKTIPDSLMTTIIKNECKDVYICLDNDARPAALKAAKDLIGYNRNVYIVNLNQKDPSEIGFEGMVHILKNTKQTTEFDLIQMSL